MATMEDLTKTQIVLLTLLISFITSIATGIITTALLAEAPAGVTQTINRVVERTIETVVPAATSTAQTTKEVTIVKEEDAILASIDSTRPSLVTLTVRGSDGNDEFYALGAIVSKDGYVISDGANMVLDGTYMATLSNGQKLPAAVVSRSDDQTLALFKLASGDPKQMFTPVTFAANDPRLGQSVIALEGKTSLGVGVGRVTAFGYDPASPKTLQTVSTDIPPGPETAGGPLVNLSGELVGIKSSSQDASLPAGVYTILSRVKAFIQNPPKH